MKGVIIHNLQVEPYPHDYLINRLFLWIFPQSVKPNHITIFRMLATPVVFFFLAVDNWKVALPVFILVAFTDALDGSMARIRKQITPWGTFFDPLADKILIAGALFILILKYVDILIAGAIIFFELVVIVAAWLKKKEGVIIAASHWGKTKMVLQVLGISMILLSLAANLPMIGLLAEWTLVLSIGFSILNIVGRDFGI